MRARELMLIPEYGRDGSERGCLVCKCWGRICVFLDLITQSPAPVESSSTVSSTVSGLVGSTARRARELMLFPEYGRDGSKGIVLSM